MIIVRYDDDFIVGFQHEADARRFLDEMRHASACFPAASGRPSAERSNERVRDSGSDQSGSEAARRGGSNDQRFARQDSG
jgi:hypothetical protein